MRPRSFSSDTKIAIVRSMYNEELTQSLLNNCLDELSLIIRNSNAMVFECPGGFEVPAAVEYIFQKENPDIVIALGVIIRGETMHGDLIAASITNALQEIAVRRIKPVIHEVLLVNSHEQAFARCVGSELNRGREAARAASRMLQLFDPSLRHIEKKSPF
jgi:6,7-dimethyl-8-ribityllumazine synthase